MNKKKYFFFLVTIISNLTLFHAHTTRGLAKRQKKVSSISPKSLSDLDKKRHTIEIGLNDQVISRFHYLSNNSKSLINNYKYQLEQHDITIGASTYNLLKIIEKIKQRSAYTTHSKIYNTHRNTSLYLESSFYIGDIYFLA
ncbi:MAG: hypothetical protein AAF380_02335 [Bacteroidota bacterium]